jgi:hypothetical protein
VDYGSSRFEFADAATFLDSIAPNDLIKSVDRGYFATLRSLIQRSRGLLKAGIADAIDCAAILVDLKEHHILRGILFGKHCLLLVVKQDAEPTACNRHQGS